MDIIYSGWLTKSPPEKKLNGPIKFLKAKWKHRFFVLGKPSGSLPDVYALDYYKDEQLKKLIGRVDLDQCEEITSSLKSSQYKHLFSLKTKHKNRERVYYLAADSEPAMVRWVDYLCSVCGLKQDEDDDVHSEASLPPVQSDSSAAMQTGEAQRLDGLEITTASKDRKMNEYAPEPGKNKAQATALASAQAEARGYIPLDECYSGSRSPPMQQNGACLGQIPPASSTLSAPVHTRYPSSDSIPDVPPPPPPKDATPPPRSPLGQAYDSPPKRITTESVLSDTYDFPPVHHPSRYYNLDDFDVERQGHRSMTYDTPPPRKMSLPTGQLDSLYKLPPPPKPTSPDRDNVVSAAGLYAVPPSRHEGSIRDSNSSRSSGVAPDSGFTSEEYDLVPRKYSPEEIARSNQDFHVRRSFNQNDLQRKSAGDTYDIPPTKHSVLAGLGTAVPPPRPPKPVSGPVPDHHATPYQNLPSNSKVFTDLNANIPVRASTASTDSTADDIYSFPKRADIDESSANQGSTDPILAFSPPPPTACQKVPHKYINAATGFVEEPAGDGQTGEGRNETLAYYMDMEGSTHTLSDRASQRESTYTFMGDQRTKGTKQNNISLSAVVQQPPSVHGHTISQAEAYVNLGDGGSREGDRVSSLYQVPPSSRPVLVDTQQVTPPMVRRNDSGNMGRRPTNTESTMSVEDTYSISSTARTRSFRRETPAKLHSSPRQTQDIPLPKRVPPPHGSFSSSSDDDSEDERPRTNSNSSAGSSGRRLPPPPPPVQCLQATPPAPRKQKIVEYLDLDLSDHSSDQEKSPRLTRSPPAAQRNQTDYKEIDFLKTKALEDIKRDLDSKRKSNDTN
ncbi:GRB2-associated-binding protein 1 isoform X3 [Lingula anatina]|uniref:GRB2-associated-binding protein 1 isoform X3 n=1 Tax=Lingula anatina TaxID=7574 RepID=A0A1S3JU55_LINAN|nr:GRB2-associated-binding protein 1 isoform X3 [Lingula anatina]|eukprot:XP_013413862.1 GRB2-associated-binding protein 1 isoform X3 [Lingula anatina]